MDGIKRPDSPVFHHVLLPEEAFRTPPRNPSVTRDFEGKLVLERARSASCSCLAAEQIETMMESHSDWELK